MAGPDRHATRECRLDCGCSGRSNKLAQHEQKPHWRYGTCGLCCTATSHRLHSKIFPGHSWEPSISILPVLKERFLRAIFKEFNINPDTISFATALLEADVEPIAQLEATASVVPRLAAFGSSLEDVPHFSRNQPWSPEFRGFNIVYDYVSTNMRTSSAPVSLVWMQTHLADVRKDRSLGRGVRSDNPTLPSRIMRELAQGVCETQGVIFGHPIPSMAPFFTVPQFLTRKFGIQRHHVSMPANVTLRASTKGSRTVYSRSCRLCVPSPFRSGVVVMSSFSAKPALLALATTRKCGVDSIAASCVVVRVRVSEPLGC